MKARDLVDRWTQHAELLESLDDPKARVFRRCAEELERALAGEVNDLLPPDQAAAASGYNKDSLGRLERAGKLTNYGKRHAPLYRRGDLPKKVTAGPDLTIASGRRDIVRRRRTS